jgi:nitroreductase
MKDITILTRRVSAPRLTSPAPSSDQLALLFAAAARAADHGLLKPYRFLVVTGEPALTQLGQLYRHASLMEDPSQTDEQLARTENLPHRAPMVVVAIAVCQAHQKVPKIEQELSAAAAVQNLITAAYALEIGACWRTGALAYSAAVKQGLGLSDNESIIGFIYLGTPSAPLRSLREQDQSVTVAHWPH